MCPVQFQCHLSFLDFVNFKASPLPRLFQIEISDRCLLISIFINYNLTFLTESYIFIKSITADVLSLLRSSFSLQYLVNAEYLINIRYATPLIDYFPYIKVLKFLKPGFLFFWYSFDIAYKTVYFRFSSLVFLYVRIPILKSSVFWDVMLCSLFKDQRPWII
jgi:hypothetical protein